MTAALLIGIGGPVLAAVIAWLCTRGYYRAAYGDRYERGYADGQARQIRVYQDARVSLGAWRETRILRGLPPPEAAWDAHSDDDAVTVLGSWYPRAAGPPRYAELSPEQLDGGPPTSEWARNMIAGIEQWNAEHQLSGGPPWHG